MQRDLQQLECDARQLKATLDAERKSHETKQNRLKSCANALRDENERLQEELTSVSHFPGEEYVRGLTAARGRGFLCCAGRRHAETR